MIYSSTFLSLYLAIYLNSFSVHSMVRSQPGMQSAQGNQRPQSSMQNKQQQSMAHGARQQERYGFYSPWLCSPIMLPMVSVRRLSSLKLFHYVTVYLLIFDNVFMCINILPNFLGAGGWGELTMTMTPWKLPHSQWSKWSLRRQISRSNQRSAVFTMTNFYFSHGQNGYFFPPDAFLRRRRKKALLRVNDQGGGWRTCILAYVVCVYVRNICT